MPELCEVPGCNAECPPGSNICSYHREIFDEDVNPSMTPIDKAWKIIKNGIVSWCSANVSTIH